MEEEVSAPEQINDKIIMGVVFDQAKSQGANVAEQARRLHEGIL